MSRTLLRLDDWCIGWREGQEEAMYYITNTRNYIDFWATALGSGRDTKNNMSHLMVLGVL